MIYEALVTVPAATELPEPVKLGLVAALRSAASYAPLARAVHVDGSGDLTFQAWWERSACLASAIAGQEPLEPSGDDEHIDLSISSALVGLMASWQTGSPRALARNVVPTGSDVGTVGRSPVLSYLAAVSFQHLHSMLPQLVIAVLASKPASSVYLTGQFHLDDFLTIAERESSTCVLLSSGMADIVRASDSWRDFDLTRVQEVQIVGPSTETSADLELAFPNARIVAATGFAEVLCATLPPIINGIDGLRS